MELLKRKLNQRIALSDIDLTDRSLLAELVRNQQDFKTFLETYIVPSNGYYAKTFLKEFLDQAEHSQGDIADNDDDFDLGEYYELYLSLMSAVAKPTEEPETVRYSTLVDAERKVPVGDVLINETPRLLNAFGCTGYRTWNAGIFFADYLAWHFETLAAELLKQKSTCNSNDSQNGQNITRKLTVVELGAGTGLVSLTLFKNYRHLISDLYVTDGEPEVLGRIKENFTLNSVNVCETLGEDSVNSENPDGEDYTAHLQELWWGSVPVPAADLIVAADVTYDSSLLPALTDSLQDALSRNPFCTALLACTIRKEETIGYFEGYLAEKALAYEVVLRDPKPGVLLAQSEASCVYLNRSLPEIRVYKIHSKL